MKNGLRICFIIGLGLLFTGGLSAKSPDKPKQETKEEEFFQTEQLVVSASKKEQKIEESPSTIHVITEQDILTSGARTLAELLRMVPGVQVRTWLSQYENVSIRGGLGATVVNTQILWMIDGVSINDVRDGGVWLDTTFPLEMIKRIEIILGPGSALYGTNAFMGVINIITKKPEDYKHRLNVFTSLGSFRTTKNYILYADRYGKFSLLVDGSWNYTDGPGLVTRLYNLYTPVYDSNGNKIENQYTKNGDLNTHSQRQWQYIDVKAGYKTTNHSVDAHLGFKNLDADFDGASFFPNKDYTFNHMWAHGNVIYNGKIEDRFYLKAFASYQYFRNNFENYSDRNLFWQSKGQEPPSTEMINYNVDQNKFEGLIEGRINLGDITKMILNDIIIGLNFRYEQIFAPEFIDGQHNNSIFNFGSYVQMELQPVKNLFITLGIRFDYHQNYDNQYHPRISVLYKIIGFTFRYSFGTAFKEPAMWHLFVRQTDAEGNPSLVPEKLQTHELAITYRYKKWIFTKLTGFYTKVNNIISNNFDASLAIPDQGIYGKFHPVQTTLNADGLEINNEGTFMGFELHAESQFTKNLRLWANYAYLWATDANGKELQYDSRHKVNAGFQGIFNRFLMGLSVHWVSNSMDTGGVAPMYVPSYTMLLARASVKIFREIAVGLSGALVFYQDSTKADGYDYYYEMLGVPIPRYTIMADLSGSFF